MSGSRIRSERRESLEVGSFERRWESRFFSSFDSKSRCLRERGPGDVEALRRRGSGGDSTRREVLCFLVVNLEAEEERDFTAAWGRCWAEEVFRILAAKWSTEEDEW